MKRVLVVATSRKTRGGITSVVKAHETGEQWKKFHCRWIETHRDGNVIRKMMYFLKAYVVFFFLVPFCDLVHIHSADGPSAIRKICFARIARLWGKKIIVHFHPPAPEVLIDKQVGPPTHRLFNMADLIIVLAPQWKKWIEEAYKEEKYNFKVLYNPCPIAKRDSYRKKENYILYAGKLSKRKGFDRLLNAFAKISDEFPEWKIKFAGNGLLDDGKTLVHKLGINNNQVEFLGWVSGSQKDEVFNRASIYCLPSDGEGFPMGVLDAIAYGVPVVTTPVGGIMDAMHNGIDCLIYDVKDIEQLAVCLRSLMSSEVLREQLVCEADKLRDNEFNVTHICQQLGEIYSGMTS